MEPELEKRLTRIENMLAWVVDNTNPDELREPEEIQKDMAKDGAFQEIVEIFNPPKTERPDIWDEKKSAEAEAKKKHIKKHSKLPSKEKAARIAELTEKAFQ